MIYEQSILIFLIKAFFLFAFFIYITFATVVVRQVHLMTDTLKVGFETQIKLFAWAHFFLAIGVFVFALFSL